MSAWAWYRNISPRTRMYMGIGIMAWAGIGMYVSDQAESYFGYTPSEAEKKQLKDSVPKIRVMDREVK